MKCDLVVFDEYHFGAWRETAKELFEGEDDAVANKETKLEYAAGLERMNEDLSVLSEKEPCAPFLAHNRAAPDQDEDQPFRILPDDFSGDQTLADVQGAGVLSPAALLPHVLRPANDVRFDKSAAQGSHSP